MKRFLSLMLTLVMVLSMAVPVMADNEETYSITIKNDAAGHTYEAYQIFKGELVKDDSTTPASWKISDATWGNGVTTQGQTKFGDPIAKAESLTSQTVAKTFAVELVPYLDQEAAQLSEEGNDGTYVIKNLQPGYYLIKDQDASLSGDASSYTTYILKVAENTEIEPKSAAPTSEKKVDDAADSTNTESAANWYDSADYDIGDNVPFQLNGTLPDNFGEYTSYKMIFHDKQSAGLTFNPESVKVYVKHLEGRKEVATGYEVKTSALTHEDCTFEIVLDDVRKLYEADGDHIAVTKNSTIQIEYTSELNAEAAIGSKGNPNTMYMEYSNNPNNEAAGETGNTKQDTVIVFTYKTVINKVDGEQKPLAGAGFSLEKKILGKDGTATWKEIDSIRAGEATTFEFKGLDDGHYRVKEIDTPEGYNSINDFYFEIVAQHDLNSDAPRLTLLRANQIDKDGLTIDENIIFNATINLNEGSITSNIVNKSGATLPETGGMGTTLFYVIGAVLVLGAGVTLVARKRINR
ncbi:MAG: isopeptide-forming domain-containing fimbrial protein [Firmicutes bacterium]|nr:isopeptide-forming domain-containing fimbrial protein [Bacillota bacterium]